MVPDPLDSLTNRERDVLNCSMAGLTDKEVSSALGLSLHTVRTYWDRMREKFGDGSTRAQVIAKYARRTVEMDCADIRKTLAVADRMREQLEVIIGKLPTMVWCVDRDYAIVYTNDLFRAYTEMDVGDNVLTDARFVPTFDHERFEQAVRHARESQEPLEIQIQIQRRDGAFRWHLVRGIGLRGDLTSVIQRVGTAIDIQDMQDRQAIISDRRCRLRLALDKGESGAAIYDPETGAEYYNRAFEQFTGGPFHRDWLMRVDPRDRPTVASAWTAVRETGEVLSIRTRYEGAGSSHTCALPLSGGGWVLVVHPGPPPPMNVIREHVVRLAMILNEVLHS